MNCKIVFYTSVIVISSSYLFYGCQNKAQRRAGAGALIGAGIGQLAGEDTESTLAGAAIGAGTGYILGEFQQDDNEVHNNPHDFTKVNFHNSDGKDTTVALRNVNGGYVGPEGEYYQRLPSRETLRQKYGY